jgi:hypothetical protein
MTVIRLNIVSRVRFKKRLIRGTKRGEGHGWYTGGASAVRNGMEDTVGTREGLLRYGTERDQGHDWYTGGASAVRNGVRGTVGTREGLLRYGTG